MKYPKVAYEELEVGTLALRLVDDGSPFSIKYVGIVSENGFFCLNAATDKQHAYPTIETDIVALSKDTFYVLGNLSKVLYDIEDNVLRELGY